MPTPINFTSIPYYKLPPIADLDFSVRTFNVLARGGVNTEEQLRALTLDQLAALKGMNRKCANEIICFLLGIPSPIEITQASLEEALAAGRDVEIQQDTGRYEADGVKAE